MSAVATAEDRLWAHVPAWLWPRVPALGLVTTDGGWLRARTGAGLVFPLVGFLVGAWRGGWRPANEVTYGYSLPWLCVLLVIALAGTGVALWVWSGYVLADVVVFDHVVRGADISAAEFGLRILAPLLVSHLLLAVLLVATPLLALIARGTVTGLLGGLSSVSLPARATCGAVGAALAAGLNAGFWTQAYPLLVRPVWTWHPSGGSPETAGIAPVQTHAWLLGLVAAAAAAGWGWLAVVSLERRVVGHRVQPVAAPPRGSRTGAPVVAARAVAASAVRAVLTTLLLAGLIGTFVEAALTVVALGTAFTVQTLLLPRTRAARWWTARLPAVLRWAVAATAAWLVAWQIGRTALDVASGNSFLPLLVATTAAIVVTALLLPAATPERIEEGGDRAARDGAP